MIAEDDDEASKTEEPSERKISKAKEEGDIAISQDAKIGRASCRERVFRAV